MTPRRDGNGSLAAADGDATGVRFFLESSDDVTGDPTPAGAVSRLAAARVAFRNAQRAEWDERQRAARAGVEGLTPVHAALVAARQAQSQAAEAVVADLRRRAASLRHAIALAEEGLAAHQRLLERLRRELAEIGE